MVNKVHIEPKERRMCTVLFADIVRSTMIIGGLDPEDAVDHLGPAIELIMSTCEKFGATTLFTGDGALAVFGSPLADEDHAIKAIASAHKIIEQIAIMSDEELDVRIGVHSGELLVGHLQHTAGEEQAFLGPVMNIASKIENRARKNTVTVSENVIESIGGIFEHIRAGELALDNIAEPIRLFEVRERNEQMSRWHSRPRRERSPFVGRAPEMDQLLESWSQSRNGHGKAVCLLGAAGVGKSRLLHEFVAKTGLNDHQILEFNCISLDQEAAFLPITRLIDARLSLSAATSKTTLEGTLSRYLGDIQQLDDLTKHVLFSLFSHVRPQSGLSATDPSRRRRLLIDALSKIILAIGSGEPFLLIFEDLHWADSGTLDVLNNLLELVSSTSTMILLSSRTSEFISDTPQTKPLDFVHVSPLDTTACKDLIQQLLGKGDVDELVADYIEDLSGRTPLFVEEFAHHVLDRLEGDRRQGKSLQNLDDIEVPARVQPLIAARIDALDIEDRQALQLVAVGGLQWNRVTLFKALQSQGFDAEQRISSLIDRGLLEVPVTGDPTKLRFSHALVQKVGYRSIPRLRRTKLHKAVFETLPSVGSSDDLDLMQSIARHADGGELWLEAAEAYNKCGELSIKRFSFDAAVSYFENAQRCSDKQRKGDMATEAMTLGLRARRGLRVSLVASGNFERILNISREAEELCEEIGDTTSRIASQIDQGIMLTVLSDVRDALKVSQLALDNAEQSDSQILQANAAFALAQAAWFHGDYTRAVEAIDRHADLFLREFRITDIGTTGSISVLGLATRANALTMLDRFEEAEADIQNVLSIAAETGKAYDQSFALVARGISCWKQGKLEQGAIVLRKALETSDVAGIDVLCCFAAAPLARVLALRSEFTEARAVLSRGLELAQRMKMEAFEAWLLAAEVRVLDQENYIPETQELRQELVNLCNRNGYEGFRGLLDDFKRAV